MATAWQGPQGFSILLQTTNKPYAGGEPKELMQDAICLLQHRWQIEFEMREIDGTWYAWGKQKRFTAGEITIQKALGDLFTDDLIIFQRGAPDDSFDSALRYQQCKRKWNVPEQVSLSSDDTGGATIPAWLVKKKKFSP